MNFDLFEKLKNAGFPLAKSYSHMDFDFKIGEMAYLAPKLSDVIREIGLDFGKLVRDISGAWYAADAKRKVFGRGGSPEEAAIRLYINLHE